MKSDERLPIELKGITSRTLVAEVIMDPAEKRLMKAHSEIRNGFGRTAVARGTDRPNDRHLDYRKGAIGFEEG